MSVRLLLLVVVMLSPSFSVLAVTPAQNAINIQLEGCIGSGIRRGNDLVYQTVFCKCFTDTMRQELTDKQLLGVIEQQKNLGRNIREVPEIVAIQPKLNQCQRYAQIEAAKPIADRANGAGFSIPVADGFFEPRSMGQLLHIETIRQNGGVVLVQRNRPENSVEGWFYPASIVIVPTGEDSSHRANKELCNVTAESLPGDTESIDIISGADGNRCQIKKSLEKRGSTFSLFVSNDDLWGVTCNYDVRDELANAACAEVFDGWLSR